jgi:hypothetical protein
VNEVQLAAPTKEFDFEAATTHIGSAGAPRTLRFLRPNKGYCGVSPTELSMMMSEDYAASAKFNLTIDSNGSSSLQLHDADSEVGTFSIVCISPHHYVLY